MADRFEDLTAAWTSAAGDGSTEPLLDFANLASSSKTPDSYLESGVFRLFCCSFNADFKFAEQLDFLKTQTASLLNFIKM